MRADKRSLRSSWVWVLALFTVASFAEAAFWGQINAFTPLYLPRLGIRPQDVAAWTGAIVAISSAVGLPFLPLWGALADRYARQPVIVRSFVAHLLAGILAVLAGNIWVFVLARAVGSFSLGNSGLMLTTLSERAPARRAGLAFAIMNTASPTGAFLGPILGGPVVDAWGVRPLLAINTAVMLLVVVAMAIGYRDRFMPSPPGQRASLWAMSLDSVGIIVRSPRLRALFPALFLVFAGWMLAFTYIPLVVAQLYRGPALGTVVGVVLGAGGLIALVMGPLLGALADRAGHWRVLLLGLALEVLLWPLPALTHDLVSFGVAWALLNGVASGCFALSFSVLASSAESAVRGRVMSFAYLPTNAGFFVGPALGALIARGNLVAIFPVAAVLTTLGIGALLLAHRQPPSVAVASTPMPPAPEEEPAAPSGRAR